MVSGKKRRLVENDYDLDLSYITPRLIAMAFPANGIEAIYRNNIKDVAKYLNEKHPNNYFIINLSGRKYDYEKFKNKVESFEWIDHHAPPLPTIVKICYRMVTFLREDINNIIVINCQAGKGRTGTIICCFLLLTKVFEKSKECFYYYAKKRFSKGEGVSQPAQKRYVDYFHHLLTKTYCYPFIVNIFGIYVSQLPKSVEEKFRPFFEFYLKNTDQLSYSNRKDYNDQKKIFVNEKELIDISEKSFSRQIVGDLTIKLYNNEVMKTKEIGRVSFNTAFLNPDDTILTFHLHEIDPDILIYKKSIPKDFKIVIKYKIVCSCQKQNSSIDDICQNCFPLLETDIEEWKELNKILNELKIDKDEGMRLLYGNEKDDIKETLFQSAPEEENEIKNNIEENEEIGGEDDDNKDNIITNSPSKKTQKDKDKDKDKKKKKKSSIKKSKKDEDEEDDKLNTSGECSII